MSVLGRLILTQGCAVSHQISTVGSSQEAYSKVPASMNSRSGMASLEDTIAEPRAAELE
jgi:hypothetical protein